MRNNYFSVPIIVALFTLVGCEEATRDISIADPTESEVMLNGLSSVEEQAYKEGRDLFFRTFTVEDGLGPFFAEASCGKCHEGAGRGPGKVLRIGRTVNGRFDPMIEFGGPTIQFRSAIKGIPGESVPPEAQFVDFRVAPAVFGRGLVEAIPEETILSNADPYDADADGISGRANYISMNFVGAPTHPELGRHGLKAQLSRLMDFADNAFLHDLGMTSPMRPSELINPAAPNIKDGKKGNDITQSTLEKVDLFIRLSDFPPMLPDTPDIIAGRNLFATVGCVRCHVPSMTTGPHPVAALSNKSVSFYSDFLIHDMGPTLSDGVLDGDAQPQEWKTPVLRGMRFFREFLHDGRATTLHDAIVMHGGEATAIRDAYLNLSSADRDKIVQFVRAL